MAAKLALIFAFAFVVFMALSYESEATIIKREVATPETPKKGDIEDALDSMKKGFEDFMTKVQTSDIYQNATKALEEFGQKLKEQGDEIVQKIKDQKKSTN